MTVISSNASECTMKAEFLKQKEKLKLNPKKYFDFGGFPLVQSNIQDRENENKGSYRQVALHLEEQLNWNDCQSGQVHQEQPFYCKMVR